MLSGEDCPMCADAHLPANLHGELIAELPGSYVRLCYNQTQPGYCAVVAKRHVPELFDLSTDELALFWTDVAAIAQVVHQLFRPVKIDYLVMGHLCPHVHCHVYPQYEHDDPHGLLNPKNGDVRLSASEFRQRLNDVRQRIARSART